MINKIKRFWQAIRRLSGDDAYEQYVQHYQQHLASQLAAEHHLAEPSLAEHSVAEQCMAENSTAGQPALLSREAFFKQWQEKKWTGIKRCC